MEITSRKTKLLKKIKPLYVVFILLIVAVTLIFTVTSFEGQRYLTNHCSNKICSLVLSESYKIRSSIDPRKLNYDRLFSEKPNSLNITVSRKDIANYNQQIRQSMPLGFHEDRWKEWQTVDLQIGDDKFKKIKMKLHGTATTNILQSNAIGSFAYRVSKKLGMDPHERKDFGLGELSASFKLKLNNDKFFNGIRKFTLISSGDEWTAGSIALTKMAEHLGAIVSVPKIVHGNFNGTDAGIYLISEEIDKELLERNYGITDYGILKSNDVWDKAFGINHVSMTDYTSHDKEQSGAELASEYALGQFERLMKIVELNNMQDLTRLIELDDFARFSALTHFYGVNNASAGDNLRYLYDFSSGKFRLILRIEGDIKPRLSFYNNPPWARGGKPGLPSFDKAVGPFENHRILNLLVNNKEFNQKRRYYLDYISQNQGKLLDDLQESIFELSELSRKTSKSVLWKIYSSISEQENLKSNILSIEKYLNYHKFYISHVLTNSTLEVLNESTFAVTVSGVTDCEGKFYQFDTETTVLPNYFKEEWLIPGTIKIPEEINCISDIKIKDENDKIFKENIYINRRRDSSDLEVNFLEFNSLFDGAVTRTNDTHWQVIPGEYTLKETVLLPYGVSLKLEPGVSIKLGPAVGLLIRGDFVAIGDEQKIKISAAVKSKPFGAIAVIGSKNFPSKVVLSNFDISGGSEGIFDYVYFSGQMSVHYGDVKISRSRFSDSSSDDGLNIKYSNVAIDESRFINNSGDQLDCDFCIGQLNENYFSGSEKVKSSSEGTDGLDLSGSKVAISKNVFLNFTDKAISIGEFSEVKVINNSISYSNLGIAVKDGSIATLIENKFSNNQQDVEEYIKKKMYPLPKILYE